MTQDNEAVALKPCPFCEGPAMKPWLYGWTFGLGRVLWTGCNGNLPSRNHAPISMKVSDWNARPQPSTAALADELVEFAAKAIFNHWQFWGDDDRKPAWQERGNSIMQQKARDLATAALRSQPAPDGAQNAVFELGELIDGLDPLSLRMFFELRRYDDEEGAYRNLADLAQACERSEEDVRAALEPLIKLDWVDHGDDLLTLAGEPFGEGFALYEDGDRLRSIYETLCEGDRAACPPTEQPAPDGWLQPDFQKQVAAWMLKCFTPEITADTLERNDRFIEEALELVQSLGYSADRAHSLVDYVFGRPQGEPIQEVGGVMVTLAALCGPNGLDMAEGGNAELARINRPEIIEKIRTKHASKPVGSALPVPPPPKQGGET